MRIAVFCEVRRDFETATTLVDRALCSRADWIADLFPEHPEAARTWVEDGSGRSFFDLHRCLEDATARGERRCHPKREASARALTANDPDRESRCLTEPALETLRTRGEGAGLRAFLDDIEARLVPLANPSPRSS